MFGSFSGMGGLFSMLRGGMSQQPGQGLFGQQQPTYKLQAPSPAGQGLFGQQQPTYKLQAPSPAGQRQNSGAGIVGGNAFSTVQQPSYQTPQYGGGFENPYPDYLAPQEPQWHIGQNLAGMYNPYNMSSFNYAGLLGQRGNQPSTDIGGAWESLLAANPQPQPAQSAQDQILKQFMPDVGGWVTSEVLPYGATRGMENATPEARFWVNYENDLINSGGY